MAWRLFFQGQGGIRGTTVPANYLRMGTVFAVAAGVCVLMVSASTFHLREQHDDAAIEECVTSLANTPENRFPFDCSSPPSPMPPSPSYQ